MSGKKSTNRRKDFIKRSSRRSDSDCGDLISSEIATGRTGRYIPRNDDIRVCCLIDVAPDFYTGGGQVHLTNLSKSFGFRISDFGFRIFGGPSPKTFVRFLWVFWVIPQVTFFHFFRRRFDLIHAHSVPAMAAGKILSLVLRIPIAVTIHGSLVSNQESPWRMPRRLLARFLEKWILTGVKYDVQITVSRNFLEIANINKNVVYIPNGVNLEVFKGPTLPRQGRTLLDKIVLFVGRKNDPVKGFKILEKAMKLVKQEIPDAKLLAADGSVSRDEVIKMYFRADLFVLPSLSEGFPLTLLEAWAAKLPVVATAVGEVSYIVKDGINGYLVPPGEVESLAEAIITALKNPDLAKLGKNGYNLVKRFNWDLVARKTMRVYNAVLVKER